MKSIATLIAAVVIITTHFTTHSASARIGETMEECVARYGNPNKYVLTGGKGILFQMAGMLIVIDFQDGRAATIIFSKGQTALSDEEVGTLLRANGGGQRWQLIEKGEDTKWLTTDGNIAAIRSGADGSLVISTKAANEARVAAKAKKLSGF